MIIYEVNVNVDASVLSDFLQWMDAHIARMLQFPGFEQAEIFYQQPLLDEPQAPSHHCVVVCYRILEMSYLDQYLTQHAAQMRAEGAEAFGAKIQASRRILHLKHNYTRSQDA